MNGNGTLTTRRPLLAGLAATSVLLAVILTGCGGSNGSGSPSASTGSATQFKDQAATDAAGAAPAAASGPASASGSGAKSPGLLADSLATTKRVRSADLTLQVKDIGEAAALAGATAQDVLVLRVPEPRLDEAISAVAAIGTELTRTTSSQDVTAVLADLESRESSQRASVARVRALMVRATSLQDIVLLESELSHRETDLEAAEASRRALADQAAQATFTVTLTTSSQPSDGKRDDNGFLAGLDKGWHALLASTGVLLTIAGASLPVLIVLLALAWPSYRLFRRYRPAGRRPATPARTETS